jgi:hypothetical protein
MMLSLLDQILYTPCYRSTKSYNTWNRIRKRTSLIRCPSCSVGEFTVTFHLDRFILLCCFHCPYSKVSIILQFSLSVVTGMEANVDMFTSSFDLKDLCHHMILLISTPMQMHTRSIFNLHHEFRFLMPEYLASGCFCFLNSSTLSYLNAVG